MPTDRNRRRRGRAGRRSSSASWARPSRIRPSARPSVRVEGDRRSSAGDRLDVAQHDPQVADPERALLGVSWSGGPEGWRRWSSARRRALDRRVSRSGRLAPQVVEDDRLPDERVVATPSIVTIVRRLETGGRRRRVGLDLGDLDAERQRQPARSGKDRERQETFITTPATRMTSLPAGRCADERARVVRGVAVLALELHEAADRQPVEGVERLALRAQDLRPRRKPDPELEDPHAGQTGETKWPSSWTSTRAEDRKNRTTVMSAWRSRSSGAPDRARGEGRADLGVEGDRAPRGLALVRARPEPVDRGLEHPRDPGKPRVPVEEPRDGDLVGGDQGGRRARARCGRPRGRAQGREACLVGRPEVQPARPRRGRARPPARAGGRGGSWRTGWGVAYPGCPAGPSGSRRGSGRRSGRRSADGRRRRSRRSRHRTASAPR